MPVTLGDNTITGPDDVRLNDFIKAHDRIRPYILRSPLRYSKYLSQLSGAEVWLKLEAWQPTGSFKVRGAVHKLLSLSSESHLRGIVTASAGNHGLGVAHAAEALGLDGATVFVPQTAPKAKVEKLARYAVTLRQTGQTYDDAHQAAETFAAQTGAQYIPAYDDIAIILGQGTCALEILLDLPETDIILVPTGGGGLLSGIALVAKAVNPLITVIGLQPEASPAAKLSLAQGRAIDPYNHQPTIADGLAGGFGLLPFMLVRTLVEKILLYSEQAIKEAVFSLAHQEQLIIEAAGAIAVAPLLQGLASARGKTVVAVLSGANIDTALLEAILARSSIE